MVEPVGDFCQLIRCHRLQVQGGVGGDKTRLRRRHARGLPDGTGSPDDEQPVDIFDVGLADGAEMVEDACLVPTPAAVQPRHVDELEVDSPRGHTVDDRRRLMSEYDFAMVPVCHCPASNQVPLFGCHFSVRLARRIKTGPDADQYAAAEHLSDEFVVVAAVEYFRPGQESAFVGHSGEHIVHVESVTDYGTMAAQRPRACG